MVEIRYVLEKTIVCPRCKIENHVVCQGVEFIQPNPGSKFELTEMHRFGECNTCHQQLDEYYYTFNCGDSPEKNRWKVEN